MSWHLQGNVNHHVCPLLLRRRRLLGTLGYPSFCLCFRGIQIADLVNHVLVQPDERKSLLVSDRKNGRFQISKTVLKR